MILERIRFMKVNKHKEFSYSPRFYDERKERIEKIKDKYKHEEASFGDSAERRASFRDDLQTSWRMDAKEKSSRAANIRLVVIMAALLLAAYYILGYVDTFSAEVIDLNN